MLAEKEGVTLGAVSSTTGGRRSGAGVSGLGGLKRPVVAVLRDQCARLFETGLQKTLLTESGAMIDAHENGGAYLLRKAKLSNLSRH